MTDIPHDPAHPDVPSDAHLRQALRHAPDAEALPPAAVREAILRQARVAAIADRPVAARKPTPSFIYRLMLLWDWLARPAVASGFASLMVATVVSLMWWDRPPDPTFPPRERPTPAPMAPVPAPTSPPTVQTLPAPAPRAAPRAAPNAPAEDSELRRLRREAPREQVTESTHTAAPQRKAMADAARPAAPAPAPIPATAPAAPTSPDMPAAAPSPGQAAPASLARSPQHDAPAPQASASQGEGDSAPAELTAAARARSQRAAPQAAAMARSEQAHDSPATTMAQLKASLAREPGRWTWQHEGSTPQPLTPALSAWVAQLDAAAPEWQPMAGSANAPFTELQLLQDGQVAHTWRLIGDTVHWQTDSGTRLAASLSGNHMGPLRLALQEALR